MRHGPHRQVVRAPVGRHPARRDAAGQGPGLGRADRRGASAGRRRPTSSAPATMAPPSAATRSRCAPASRRCASWKKTACSRTPRASARRCAPGWQRELAGVAGVVEIRGQGLMLGIELDRPCGELLGRAAEAGLMISVTADQVIRLVPPLILSDDEAAQIVAILVPADQGLPRRAEAMKPGMSLIKHYLQFKDLRAEEYAYLFERAAIIKKRFKNYEKYTPLVDRTLAMIFEKASHAHPRQLRGRHVPDGRLGREPDHRRQPARPRRADRGQRARHQPHGRPRDDPHLRADQDRGLRGATRACR